MKPFTSLISVEEAKTIILKNTKEIESLENIDIKNSVERILSNNIKASLDVPPFDRSAMDGYAVRAEDTYGAGRYAPKILEIIEIIHAGNKPAKKIEKGKCAQIATGAPLPEGADAVVKVEDTECDNKSVKIYKAVPPLNHVAKKGEDITEGNIILKNGTELTPARVGVLAALGLDEVEVYKKPSILIVPTGNEICPLREKIKEGQIYDVNSYTLFSIIKKNGGAPTLHEIIEDDKKSIEKVLNDCEKYDLIIFSGASSVGERDLLIDIIKEKGKIHFHGVQIKPGKPTWFATVDKKPMIGLPGFPTSCLSDAYVFLIPTIRKMARLPEKTDVKITAELSNRLVSTLGREQFFTVRLKDRVAHPVFKTSGAITSMAEADGYIIIPSNVDLIEKNEKVEVYLL